MIRLALQLRWALLRGALRPGPGSTGRRMAFQFSLGIGATAGVIGCVLLAAFRGRSEADDLAILVFFFLVASWTLVPLITFSSDDLLDASKLALLPLSTREILTLHGVGALLGVAPIATAVACFGFVIGTGTDVASLVVALAALPLQLGLCVVASRTGAALLSGLLRSRRGRDFGVLVSLGLLLASQVVFRLPGNFQGDGTAALRSAADWFQSTPPGLLASAPRLAREGQLLLALGHLLVVVAVLTVLGQVWAWALKRSTYQGDTSSGTRRTTILTPAPLRLLLPTDRAGAVAAKDLRALAREPRRMTQLAMSTFFPCMGLLPLITLGERMPAAVFAVCGVAVFAGLAGGNRFGLDGTATWMMLSAQGNLRAARRDLLGGEIATAVVVLPFLLVLGPAVAWGLGGEEYLSAAMLSAGGVLAISLAASSLTSILAPFTVPESTNGFSNGGGGQGCLVGLITLAMMLGVGVVATPMLLVVLPVIFGGAPSALLLLAPLYGVAVAYGLREIAARQWSTGGPEVLSKLIASTS